jgi:hypothetical protein
MRPAGGRDAVDIGRCEERWVCCFSEGDCFALAAFVELGRGFLFRELDPVLCAQVGFPTRCFANSSGQKLEEASQLALHGQ